MHEFTWIDYAVLFAYLAGVTVLGSLFARRQTSSEDFFLAGRSVRWLPMTLSVIATDFSAISFLGVPGYVVARDLRLEIQPLVFVWGLPLALFIFVRFFYKLELISANE
jgi:SSS family solute:Na+ symporter